MNSFATGYVMGSTEENSDPEYVCIVTVLVYKNDNFEREIFATVLDIKDALDIAENCAERNPRIIISSLTQIKEKRLIIIRESSKHFRLTLHNSNDQSKLLDHPLYYQINSQIDSYTNGLHCNIS
jgi:hypothetical protein